MKRDKKIVFIAGVFDCLHEGHMYILREAKKLGDELDVAINSDADVKRRKGEGRPVDTWQIRMENLYNTDLVDWVHCIENDEQLLNIIKVLEPEFIVVGDDYTEDRVVGANECKEWDGKVVIITRIPNISTTEILKKSQ